MVMFSTFWVLKYSTFWIRPKVPAPGNTACLEELVRIIYFNLVSNFRFQFKIHIICLKIGLKKTDLDVVK